VLVSIMVRAPFDRTMDDEETYSVSRENDGDAVLL
jgi:hypothetical protein